MKNNRRETKARILKFGKATAITAILSSLSYLGIGASAKADTVIPVDIYRYTPSSSYSSTSLDSYVTNSSTAGGLCLNCTIQSDSQNTNQQQYSGIDRAIDVLGILAPVGMTWLNGYYGLQNAKQYYGAYRQMSSDYYGQYPNYLEHCKILGRPCGAPQQIGAPLPYAGNGGFGLAGMGMGGVGLNGMGLGLGYPGIGGVGLGANLNLNAGLGFPGMVGMGGFPGTGIYNIPGVGIQGTGWIPGGVNGWGMGNGMFQNQFAMQQMQMQQQMLQQQMQMQQQYQQRMMQVAQAQMQYQMQAQMQAQAAAQQLAQAQMRYQQVLMQSQMGWGMGGLGMGGLGMGGWGNAGFGAWGAPGMGLNINGNFNAGLNLGLNTTVYNGGWGM